MKANTVALATARPMRTFLGLLAPLIPLAAMAVVLASRGYSPFQYFDLIEAGHLSLWRQSLGVLATLSFITVSIRAWRILRTRCVLASTNRDEVSFLFSPHRVRVADISDVSVRQGYWSKLLVLRLSSGEELSVSTPYLAQDGATLRCRIGV